MPHWQIYHSDDTFQDAAKKQAFAKAITSHYTREGVNMPAFYVVVNFIQVPQSSHFVGGEQASSRGRPFVRILISQIHINLPKNAEVYKASTDRVSNVIRPHVEGYDWEYHIEEAERQLWRINGLQPPDVRVLITYHCFANEGQWKSEDESVWRAEDRAVPASEMEEARQKLSRL